MSISLPDYDPPPAQRAAVAAALAPLGVLLAFLLIVTRLIEVDTGMAVFAACTVWVCFEMHDFQKAIDRYNADYVARHLQWRSSATLHALAACEGAHAPTRDFVGRYLQAERVLLPDGQLP